MIFYIDRALWGVLAIIATGLALGEDESIRQMFYGAVAVGCFGVLTILEHVKRR